MSSSQVTFIFFRGVAKNHQPDIYMYMYTDIFVYLCVYWYVLNIIEIDIDTNQIWIMNHGRWVR